MSFPKLKVRVDGRIARGGNAHVWLDDLEITDWLTGVDVSFGVHHVNRATLHIFCEGIDIDAETLAVLQAHGAEQADDDTPEEATHA